MVNELSEGTASSGKLDHALALVEFAILDLRGRRFAPKGRDWDQAVVYWRTLKSDAGAKFDREVTLDARDIKPHVTWGTSPEMVVAVDGTVPDPDKEKDPKNTDKDEPMLWVAKYGKGRVYQNVMGHDVEAMQSPGFKILMIRGVEWAANGEVTTPLPPGLKGEK